MYDARSRNLFKAAVTVVTGAVAVATATGAGVLSGVVARHTEQAQAEKAAAQQTAQTADAAQAPATTGAGSQAAQRTPKRVIRWKTRPQRTVVHTTTVYEQAEVSSPSVTLGGGSIAASAPRGPAPAPPKPPGGSGGSGGSGGAPPAPSPPHPDPPSAPSTGS